MKTKGISRTPVSATIKLLHQLYQDQKFEISGNSGNAYKLLYCRYENVGKKSPSCPFCQIHQLNKSSSFSDLQYHIWKEMEKNRKNVQQTWTNSARINVH
jgi:hypothetical protein